MIRIASDSTLYTIADKDVNDSNYDFTISSVSVCNKTIPIGNDDLEHEKACSITSFIEHNDFTFTSDADTTGCILYHLAISKDRGSLILDIVRAKSNINHTRRTGGNEAIKNIRINNKEIKERAKIYWEHFCIPTKSEEYANVMRDAYHRESYRLLMDFLENKYNIRLGGFGARHLFSVITILLVNDNKFSYDPNDYL